MTTLSMYPLYICDDGCLVYYRDSEEKLADLSETQRKEIEVKENARCVVVSYIAPLVQKGTMNHLILLTHGTFLHQ